METDDEEYNLEELDKNTPEEEDFDSIDDIIDKPVGKRKREKNNEPKETTIYIEPDELWQEVKNYYELSDSYENEFPPISNKLANALNDIATKIGYRPNFINYSYRVEMIGDAKLKLFKSIRDKSIKLYSTVDIEKTEILDDENTKVFYYDKKGKLKERVVEKDDIIAYGNGKQTITFKNPIFGYMTKIAWHCYLNRIKKEKLADDTKRRFQEETWEKFLNSETGKGVRRPKMMDQDENEIFFDNE